MPRLRRGIWGLRGGLGLPVRVFLLGNIPPVGPLIVGFVARGRFEIAHAVRVGIEIGLGASLNASAVVAPALAGDLANATNGAGAGGFFVVAGGAHARMIPHWPRKCKPIQRNNLTPPTAG